MNSEDAKKPVDETTEAQQTAPKTDGKLDDQQLDDVLGGHAGGGGYSGGRPTGGG